MTGFWWCMTPIVWGLGAWAMLDRSEMDHGPSALASMIIIVPFWWAIYWAIRMVIDQ